MNIEDERTRMVFCREVNGIKLYKIGISKKDKNGNYINGYINCGFKKNTDIPNKTLIKIKQAWVDFYLKKDETIPSIFINEYEIVEDLPKNAKSEYDDSGIELKDSDLPF